MGPAISPGPLTSCSSHNFLGRVEMYPGNFVKEQPDKPAVIMAGSGEMQTYKELDDRSAQLAQMLHSVGLRRGDNVALFAENDIRYFEIFWAAMRSGLYLTTINRYLSADEAAYLVNDSGADVLIASRAMAETATTMLTLIPGCKTRLMFNGVVEGFEVYDDALAGFPADPLADQTRGEAMLYSSGTTGRPKGIKRQLSGLKVDDPPTYEPLVQRLFQIEQSSVYLCPAPLYHAAGLMWSARSQEMGATVVVMEKFDAEGFLATIEAQRITHTQVVPTMLVRLIKLPEETRQKYDLSSLKMVIHAAAPCPIEVKKKTIEWLGPIVTEHYSSTEGSGMTLISSQEWLSHPGSVGRSIQGEIHICDEDGVELAVGEPGIIYCETPWGAFEYFGDPEATRESRHPVHDSWTKVGDIGYVDEEGYLYLSDRQAFMIISGGVNIYPAEIESCLIMHDAVVDVAVFGLPDDEMGEYVHAVIQPAEGFEGGSTELAAELREFARERLAAYKVPRIVDFQDELPRLPTGKLYKRPLRAEYLAKMATHD